MSRHRNIRTINLSDDYDDFDEDYYGRSVDECLSPTDASQWLYDRSRGQESLGNFLQANSNIEELDEDVNRERRDSDAFQMPDLGDEDRAKLMSCMDEIRNVIGDVKSEQELVETIMKFNFDLAKSLDAILNSSKATPPAPVKAASTPIKVDFKKGTDLDENSKPAEKQSALQFSALKDLANHHMKNTKFSLNSGNKQFVIPKMGLGQKTELPKVEGVPQNNEFSIPKFKFKSPTVEDPSKKMAELNLSDDVDLTNALLEPVKKSIISAKTNFSPKRVELVLFDGCKLQFNNAEQSRLITERGSIAGRAICKKFKLPFKRPTISRRKSIGFRPFDFNTPSPDDLRMRILKLDIVSVKPVEKVKVSQVAVVVTPDEQNNHQPAVKIGFEVNSPTVSGRNTPEVQQQPRTRDNAPNAKELYNKERGGTKEKLHLVVIGHVDAGKSTLMGHLLCDLDNVPKRIMHKYEQESKKVGKQSFMYAWVLDETGEERSRGITMDVGQSQFGTKTKMVTILDAPGHKDFIPNMITGAAQADVALLVVDATVGGFETGFESGGQTREHALLVKSLGVNQISVVVNKLDTVSWSQSRFDEIVGRLKTFLKQVGFKESDVTYIPCSGLTGENLVKPITNADLSSWYKGPTLLTVIDAFKTPERPIDKPLRVSVSDIFKSTSSGGFCVSGRVETGCVCVGNRVLVSPVKEAGVVKTILLDSEASANSAFAGDNVSLTLVGPDVSNITIGSVVCDIQSPVPITTRFRARIIVFNVKVPITIGFPVLMHCQSLVEPATVSKLKSLLHKGTGELIKKNPRCLTNNSCAIVEITTTKPICVEKYSEMKELGRFCLRVAGDTICVGLITDILK